MKIYKILRAAEWQAFESAGQTRGAPIDLSDGYIHFSTAQQAAETAAKHFAGETDLMLLALDSNSFGDAMKWEPSRKGQLFPHLYNILQMSDVLWAKPLPLGDVSHIFPPEMT